MDPKAFFVPGRVDWTDHELFTAYGDQDSLVFPGTWARQEDYAAIVLANAPVGSAPLELSATLVRDRPRPVTLVDAEGEPVVGAVPDGLTYIPGDAEPRLRTATATVARLHPARSRRVTFVHEGRKLVGSLLARGDGDAPYTVVMRPWATVTGRIVGEDGKPLAPATGPGGRATISQGDRARRAARDDPGAGEFPVTQPDDDGRFRVERLVPGLRYGAAVYRGGSLVGKAVDGLVLLPGEVRDLGDVCTSAPAAARAR